MGEINAYPGRIGAVIFMYRYARRTKEQKYEELAERWLDEVVEDINICTSMKFQDGIWGVGWGIEYLVRNGYIEGNTDCILEDIDYLAIAQINSYHLKDVSLNTGIVGIGRYMLARIASETDTEKHKSHLTLKEHLIYLIDWLESLLPLSEGHIGEIIEFMMDLLDKRFYPWKVKKINDFCLSTAEGQHYISTIKI